MIPKNVEQLENFWCAQGGRASDVIPQDDGTIKVAVGGSKALAARLLDAFPRHAVRGGWKVVGVRRSRGGGVASIWLRWVGEQHAWNVPLDTTNKAINQLMAAPRNEIAARAAQLRADYGLAKRRSYVWWRVMRPGVAKPAPAPYNTQEFPEVPDIPIKYHPRYNSWKYYELRREVRLGVKRIFGEEK